MNIAPVNKLSRMIASTLACQLLLVTTSYAQPAATEPRSAIREGFTETPVEKSPELPESRLTKNWGGARTTLSDAGFDIAAIYKLDMHSVVAGGVNQSTEFLGNFDLRTSFDLQKLTGWSGASFFLYLLGNHGGDPTENVGDIQGTSNIQTPVNTMKVYEAWIQQIAFDGTASFLFGLYDLNSEFYVTAASTLFLNSSFGVGAEFAPTGANGPSIFPTTAPAFRVRVEPAANYYVQSALFGAVAGDPDKPHGTQISWKATDGFLFVNEFAYHQGYDDEPSGELVKKYGVGFWTYTVPVEPIIAAEESTEKFGNYGAYLLLEQGLTSEITTFLRYGITTSKTNELSSNLSAGINLTGPFGREQDVIGLAFTRAGLSTDYRDSESTPENRLGAHETTLEMTYRIQLIPGMALQPDLQYIIQPSGDPSKDNATVAAARLELSF